MSNRLDSQEYVKMKLRSLLVFFIAVLILFILGVCFGQEKDGTLVSLVNKDLSRREEVRWKNTEYIISSDTGNSSTGSLYIRQPIEIFEETKKRKKC